MALLLTLIRWCEWLRAPSVVEWKCRSKNYVGRVLEVCWWSWRSHFEKWKRRSLRVAVKQEGSDAGGVTR